MILDYYKLSEAPFGVTPDPRFLYLSPTHREALASVCYGIQAGRGFTALIARPGMGKTTLLFELLRQLQASPKTVFIFQSNCTPRDLLSNILRDMVIDSPGDDIAQMQSALNGVLLREAADGRRVVLVIDEAQNLDESVLEVLRMLSNFETPSQKLMHIVLSGQPQLAEKLASERLVQLRQRVSIVARLKSFNEEETQQYIEHRLRIAGYRSVNPMFTRRAFAAITRYSEGIPRNINNICLTAMSLGFVARTETIDETVILEVVQDLDLRPLFFARTPSVAPVPVPPKPAVPNFIASAERIRSNTAPILSRGRLLRWGLPVATVAFLAFLLFAGRGRVVSESVPAFPSGQVPVGQPVARISQEPEVNTQAQAPREQSLRDVVSVTPSAPVARRHSQNSEASVVVFSGQTLSGISIDTLGKYDEEVLAKFRALNPWLNNPDHLDVGQELIIPLDEAKFQTKEPAAERIPATPAAGPEKP
jgi:type II secretory pathway predicted ATPase ExeA